MSHTKQRAKSWAVRAGLVAVSSLLALVGAEVGLRLLIPPYGVELFTYDAKSKRSRVMKAGYEGICYGVPIALNQNGFRDVSPRAAFPPKQPEEFRVIVLGDSATVCAGVPWGSLYTSRLQKLLQDELPRESATRVRVFNLAVAGYNIMHYRHTLEEVGLGLKPDLIVVSNYVPNDFTMEDYRRYEDLAQGRGQSAPKHQRQPLYLDLAFGPQVWRVRSAITDLFQHRPPAAPGSSVGKPSFGPGSDGWDENVNAMKEIARLTEARGIPLMVILLPHSSNFQCQTRHHDTVTRTWRDMGLNCHDTLPAFTATRLSPRLYRLNLIDSHPNARYNALVAGELARIIRENPQLNARLQPRP